MDLFGIIFKSVSPYLFAILKLALALTLYSNAIRIIRSKSGASVPGSNPYQGITGAFVGYLLGRGIPAIIGLIDVICNDILKNL